MPRSLNAVGPMLVVTPSVPASRDGDRFVVETKMLEGWREYAALWPGPTRYVFRENHERSAIFAEGYAREELPGEIVLLKRGAAIPDDVLAGAAVILGSGDSFDQFDLAAQAKRLSVPVVYIIENTLDTRYRIAAVESKSAIARLKTMSWLTLKERKRKAAFRAAAAIQANGLPAANAYGGMVRDTHLYFDTRLRRAMIADDAELAVRIERIARGAPLHLAFTGRLEKLKGAHHLVPIARALIARKVDFRLDLYGTGSVGADIAAEIDRDPVLARYVHLNRPIDFATALVPWMRATPDLFLCPHVQGDPSCTYLETLGCGVPIVGYANAAWAALIRQEPDLGWRVTAGDVNAMANQIAALSADRQALAGKVRPARDFGARNNFEDVFAGRIAHLQRVAGL